MRRRTRQAGFTLIEMLVVVAMLAILGAIASGSFSSLLRGWRLKDAANQLLEGAREAQSEAMRLGDYTTFNVGSGRQYRQQAVFLVLDVAGRGYQAWQWVDNNDNGYPDDSSTDAYTRIFSRDLPRGSSFNSGPATKVACSNGDALDPAVPDTVTFSSKAYPPCSGQACIQFDAQGVIGKMGNIYLTDGEDAYALNSLEPGFFRLCRWNGGAWD